MCISIVSSSQSPLVKRLITSWDKIPPWTRPRWNTASHCLLCGDSRGECGEGHPLTRTWLHYGQDHGRGEVVLPTTRGHHCQHPDQAWHCLLPGDSGGDSQIEPPKVALCMYFIYFIYFMYFTYFMYFIHFMYFMYYIQFMYFMYMVGLTPQSIALHDVHCMTCIAQHALHDLHCMTCVKWLVLPDLHCMTCIAWLALHYLHDLDV